jgi:hypothetical protein
VVEYIHQKTEAAPSPRHGLSRLTGLALEAEMPGPSKAEQFRNLQVERHPAGQGDSMNQTIKISLALASLTGLAAAAGLKLADLPAPVQRTVQDTLKGGEIKNISKEVEKGVTQYEVETMLNGKHRDFDVDSKGTLIDVEDEVALDGIPAPAKAAITKKVSNGKLGMVEVVSHPGKKDLLYEAAYTTKEGKKREVLVTAAGAETKD